MRTVGSTLAPSRSLDTGEREGAPHRPRLRGRRPTPATTATLLFLLPGLALLGIFFVYPLGVMVVRSVTEPTPGFENYSWFFGREVNVTVFIRTFRSALLVTFAGLVLGFIYAYVMVKSRPRTRAVLLVAVLVPLWTSSTARVFAWLILLQGSGVVNYVLSHLGLGRIDVLGTTTAVVIGMAQVLLPFAVLPIYASMSRIDLRLVTAAESLGARPIVAFWRIFFPLALPGVVAAAVVLFVTSLGFVTIPVFLGSPDNAFITVLIQAELGLLNWGHGTATGAVLLISTLLLLGAVFLAARRGGVVMKLPVSR